MIESLVAKNGDLIFTYNQRQLCSVYDPRLEGEQWAERRVKAGLPAQNLFVLGIGCGYHIEALRKAAPGKKIYVIEMSKEILEACAKVHALDFVNFNARYFSDINSLKESPWFCEAVSSSFQVLVHKPSFYANLERFTSLFRFLMARNWESLAWLWDLRTRTHLIHQLQPISATADDELTLKDLDSLMAGSPLRGQSKSWMVFKALRELIV